MEQERKWRDKLSDRVVYICERQGVREQDCEPLVKDWIEHIQNDHHRPTVSGVIATATRKIYRLAPID